MRMLVWGREGVAVKGCRLVAKPETLQCYQQPSATFEFLKRSSHDAKTFEIMRGKLEGAHVPSLTREANYFISIHETFQIPLRILSFQQKGIFCANNYWSFVPGRSNYKGPFVPIMKGDSLQQ